MRTAKILLVLLIAATPVHGETAEDILGAWEWVSTTNGDGSIDSPGSLGYTVQLQFSPDQSFLRYHDNAPVEQSEWEVIYVWILVDGGLVHVEFVSTGVGDRWEPVMVIPSALMELRNSSGGVEQYLYLGSVASESVAWGSVKALYRE